MGKLEIDVGFQRHLRNAADFANRDGLSIAGNRLESDEYGGDSIYRAAIKSRISSLEVAVNCHQIVLHDSMVFL